MQTLSEAVAALQAQRDQEAQARQAKLDRLAEAKREREVDFAAAFAAHLEAREGVDLTSPDAEARVWTEEFGSAEYPHYIANIILRDAGWITPNGSAFLTKTTMPGTEWESRGWRANFNGNWTDGRTFLDACLAVYQYAASAPPAATDEPDDVAEPDYAETER